MMNFVDLFRRGVTINRFLDHLGSILQLRSNLNGSNKVELIILDLEQGFQDCFIIH